MRRISIVLNDEEETAINQLLELIKLKVTLKRTFLEGLFKIAENLAKNEKEKDKIEELKNRIGII